MQNVIAINDAASQGIIAAQATSDEMLLERIADGDRTSMHTFYARHNVRVYRFILRIVRDATMAEDLVSQVFLDVWRTAGQFERRSQVSTWLLSIARFKALSECRRRTEMPLDDEAISVIEDPADSPATSAEKRERSDILQKCLAKLTPIHREVINLTYYHGQKIEEVARSTGAPVATIKTRLHYARNRMAELLAEAGIDRAWAVI